MVELKTASAIVVLSGVFAGALSLLLHPAFLVGSSLIGLSILLKLSQNIAGVLIVLGVSIIGFLLLAAFNTHIIRTVQYVLPYLGKYIAKGADTVFKKSSNGVVEVGKLIPLWAWTLALFLVPFAGQFVHSLMTVRTLSKIDVPSVPELPGFQSTSAFSIVYSVLLMVPFVKSSKWLQPQKVSFLLQTFWLFATMFAKPTPANLELKKAVRSNLPSILSGWGTFVLGFLPGTALATAFTVGVTASAVAAGVTITVEGIGATKKLLSQENKTEYLSQYLISWSDVKSQWASWSLRSKATEFNNEVLSFVGIDDDFSVLDIVAPWRKKKRRVRVSYSDVFDKKEVEQEFEMSKSFSDDIVMNEDEEEKVEEDEEVQVVDDIEDITAKMDEAGFDLQALSPPVQVACTILVLSRLPTAINLTFGILNTILSLILGNFKPGMVMIPIMMAPLAFAELINLVRFTGVWGLLSGNFMTKMAEKHDNDGLSILLHDNPKLLGVWRKLSLLDKQFKEEDKPLTVKTAYDVVHDYFNPSEEEIKNTPEFSTKHVMTLIGSLLIDFVGVLSFGIPIIGDLIDFIWAPISGYLIHKMYGVTLLSWVGVLEEILPFTDIIPTATIAWIYTNFGNFPAWSIQGRRKLVKRLRTFNDKEKEKED